MTYSQRLHTIQSVINSEIKLTKNAEELADNVKDVFFILRGGNNG